MGKIAEYLGDLIKKQVKGSGIVIWYDPEEKYREAVDRIQTGAQVFKFKGSFFG